MPPVVAWTEAKGQPPDRRDDSARSRTAVAGSAVAWRRIAQIACRAVLALGSSTRSPSEHHLQAQTSSQGHQLRQCLWLSCLILWRSERAADRHINADAAPCGLPVHVSGSTCSMGMRWGLEVLIRHDQRRTLRSRELYPRGQKPGHLVSVVTRTAVIAL